MLLSLAEVAEIVGYSYDHARRMRRAGHLPRPVIDTGRRLRFSLADIELWIDQGCPGQKRMDALIAERRRRSLSAAP